MLQLLLVPHEWRKKEVIIISNNQIRSSFEMSIEGQLFFSTIESKYDCLECFPVNGKNYDANIFYFSNHIFIELAYNFDSCYCCIDSISILFSICVDIVPKGFLRYCSWEFTCLKTDIPSMKDAFTFFCFGYPLF